MQTNPDIHPMFVALGISEEVEQLGLKGSKKKKSKKLDEDYLVRSDHFIGYAFFLTLFNQPTLKPLVEKDVPKVVQAMRQTQSRKVLLKLLTRVKVRHSPTFLQSFAHQLSLLSADHHGSVCIAPDHAVAWFQCHDQRSGRLQRRHGDSHACES